MVRERMMTLGSGKFQRRAVQGSGDHTERGCLAPFTVLAGAFLEGVSVQLRDWGSPLVWRWA